jgi:transposase
VCEAVATHMILRTAWIYGAHGQNLVKANYHSGGKCAAAMYSILQTAKLNGVNPQAYLTDTLSRIAAGHPISRISELMPWTFQSSDTAA